MHTTVFHALQFFLAEGGGKLLPRNRIGFDVEDYLEEKTESLIVNY